MCFPVFIQRFATVALVCLSGLAAQRIPKEKRQIGLGLATVTSQKDHSPAESEFAGFSQPAEQRPAASGKYFQDMYVAQHNPKEIEFGHVSENPKEWEQRFEKINLENLNRKGKVRWGDKHGGYGEHYWDYNHAGHNDGDGEESQQSETYEEYPEESKEALVYESSPRGKRNPDDDIEFISDKARSLIFDAKAPKHGGNYRRAKESRAKREPEKPKGSNLVYDEATGTIVDQITGMQYQLQALYN